MKKKFLSVFEEKNLSSPPIWLMRQAGRYLPEYREIREKSGGFLNLCYSPELATQVSLQPIERYHFDASILFADILLIPHALGQKLNFVEGDGPKLNPIKNSNSLRMDNIHFHLDPIYQTVHSLSQSLPPEVALIGFAGAPWTVATYMVAGCTTLHQEPAHRLIHDDAMGFDSIIDYLIEATSEYLLYQVQNGAECLQIFDSWAGSLSGDFYEKYCLSPIKEIVRNLRKENVSIPIIGFPRGIGESCKDFAFETGVDAISLDETIDLRWAVENIDENIVLQGNLDSKILLEGGKKLENSVKFILDIMKDRRHIFNLGHGILKETPPEHVTHLIQLVRHER